MKYIFRFACAFSIASFNAFSETQNLHIEIDFLPQAETPLDPRAFGYVVTSDHQGVLSRQGVKLDSNAPLARYVTFASKKEYDVESLTYASSNSDTAPILEFSITNDILSSQNVLWSAYSAALGINKIIKIQPVPLSTNATYKRPCTRTYLCEVHIDNSIGTSNTQTIQLSSCTDQLRSE